MYTCSGQLPLRLHPVLKQARCLTGGRGEEANTEHHKRPIRYGPSLTADKRSSRSSSASWLYSTNAWYFSVACLMRFAFSSRRVWFRARRMLCA